MIFVVLGDYYYAEVKLVTTDLELATKTLIELSEPIAIQKWMNNEFIGAYKLNDRLDGIIEYENYGC